MENKKTKLGATKAAKLVQDITCRTFQGMTNTSESDAEIYSILGEGVIPGVGGECKVGITGSKVIVQSGSIIAGGRKIDINSPITIDLKGELSPGGNTMNAHVVLEIDKVNSTAFIKAVDREPIPNSPDADVYDFMLARYGIDNTGAISLWEVRQQYIKLNGASIAINGNWGNQSNIQLEQDLFYKYNKIDLIKSSGDYTYIIATFNTQDIIKAAQNDMFGCGNFIPNQPGNNTIFYTLSVKKGYHDLRHLNLTLEPFWMFEKGNDATTFSTTSIAPDWANITKIRFYN